MTKIEPIDFIETTALKEREQLRNAVNGVIGEINGAAEDASAAAASALKAEQEATRSAEFAHAAQTAADAAAGDAAKVNQFDARIKGNMKDVSYAPTATEVTAVIMKEDGTIIDRPIPTLDHDRAGMMTPAQMKDISDHLDTLGRDLNNVKTEYLDKYNLQDVQLVRSKTDWERSPLVPTLGSNEYTADSGRRAYNPASAAADPALMQRAGVFDITSDIGFLAAFKKKMPGFDIDNPAPFREKIQRVIDGKGEEISTRYLNYRAADNFRIENFYFFKDTDGSRKAHRLEIRMTQSVLSLVYVDKNNAVTTIWRSDQ